MANEAPPIGKRYDGGEWRLDRSEYQAYAAATDDANPIYAAADGVAPPMYHVRPFIGLMLAMAQDPELAIDHLRLVHGEHAMRFHEPLRHGGRLQMGGSLLSVDAKASGTVYAFALEGRVDGALVLEGRTVYFVRAATPPPREGGKAREEEPPPPHWRRRQAVTPDQAVRYAAASGDLNPIHTDEAVAVRAGLPRTILHGLCTLALAARDLTDHYADADPARLASLSVRWSRPVFPGDQLTLEAWERSHAEVEFRTLGADGRPVLVDGRASFRGM